jgi:hypothetical protein
MARAGFLMLVLLLSSAGCKGQGFRKGAVDGGILGSGATADFLNRYIDAVCAHRVHSTIESLQDSDGGVPGTMPD